MRVLQLLKIPGMVTGFITGLMVGALAILAGAPAGFTATAALGLGIPLGIFGVLYDALLEKGWMPFGRLTPAALYGVLTFPIARLLQELLLVQLFGQGFTLQREAGVLPFLAFQGIMGFGYGVGFVMIHNQVLEAAAWWEYRKQRSEERKNEELQAAK